MKAEMEPLTLDIIEDLKDRMYNDDRAIINRIVVGYLAMSQLVKDLGAREEHPEMDRITHVVGIPIVADGSISGWRAEITSYSSKPWPIALFPINTGVKTPDGLFGWVVAHSDSQSLLVRLEDGSTEEYPADSVLPLLYRVRCGRRACEKV